MILVWISICIFIVWLSFIIYKDIIVPPIISGSVWIIVYILMLFINDKQLFNDIYTGCFALAFCFFFIGFGICVPRKITPVTNPEKVHINTNISMILIIVMYVSSIIWLYMFWKDIIEKKSSIWIAIRTSEISLSYVSRILVNVFPIISVVLLYGYIRCSEKRNLYLFILSLPPLLMAMLTGGRLGWFYVIATFGFTIFFSKKYENKAILKGIVIGLIIVLLLFSVSSLAKYSNIMGTASLSEQLQHYFRVYFLSPSLAYIDWLHSDNELYYGRYTFRFFIALAHIFDKNIEVPPTILPFVKVYDMYTNVYTVLYTYSMDFGLLYACFVQSILGFLFGKMYKIVKKRTNPSGFSIILISMMISILLGEFFCDTFMTQLSSWIQRIFWAYLFCRLIIINEKQET